MVNLTVQEMMQKKNEFSEVVKSTISNNLQTTVRVFSLRGCHLIAMLSKTKTAKQFRKWVLDILENHPQPVLDQSESEIKQENEHLMINPFNPHAIDVIHHIQKAKVCLGEESYNRIITTLNKLIDNSDELQRNSLISIFNEMEFNADALSGKKITQYKSWEKRVSEKNKWLEAAEILKKNKI